MRVHTDVPALGSRAVHTIDARINGTLLIVFGLLSAVLSHTTAHPLQQLAIGAPGLLVGAAFLALASRVHPWQLTLINLVVSVAICLTATAGSANTGAGETGGIAVFVVLTLQVCALRSRREAWWQYGWAMGVYGGVLGLRFGAVHAVGPWLTEAVVLALLVGAGTWTRRNFDGLVGELRRQADHDPLTGLLNRDGLQRTLTFARRRRDFGDGPSTVAVLLLDIDRFKAINDTFGHPAGDEVLVWLSGLLRGAVQPPEEAARFGGEEFLLVLPGSGLASAYDRAERVRQLVASAASSLRHPVTVSIGVACGVAPGGEQELTDLYARADLALYRAKQGGRNRVEATADEPEPVGPGAPADRRAHPRG